MALGITSLVTVGLFLGGVAGEVGGAAGKPATTPGEPSSAVQRGKRLFRSQGCKNCHSVNGSGGKLGPDLSHEATMGRTQPWLVKTIRAPKLRFTNPVMPDFAYLNDQQLNDLAAYILSLSGGQEAAPHARAAESSEPSASVRRGKSLFSAEGCTACHTVNGQGGSVGPDLSNEGRSGHSSRWLAKKIRDPKATDPNSPMPSYNQLTDRQVNDLVNYLTSLTQGPPRSRSGPGSPATSQPAAVERGEKLFTSKGCIACHSVDGRGGTLGPDLSDIGRKAYSIHWLHTKIRDPRASDPTTIMPAFSSLTNRQINDLIDYLKSLSGPGSASAGGRPTTTRPAAP